MSMLANGQLAAATATILAPGGTARLGVVLTNTSGSTTETVILTVTHNSDGTARRILRVVLAPNEQCRVTGLVLEASDTLKGFSTNASTIDYAVFDSDPGPFSATVLDATGAVRTAQTGSTLAIATAVPLGHFRVWDAIQTILPSAGANDDLGLVVNTWGTTDATIESGDSKTATTTRYARFQVPLPNNYVAGQAVTLRINAGMKTTVSDTSATVDAEVRAVGAPTVDLCATNAQSINSLTAANKDFTVTPTGLSAGDLLDVRIAVAIVDGATGTAVIGRINSVSVIPTVKV